jgi:hypothetical protein
MGETPEQVAAGWRRLSPEVDLHVVPGNHYSILTRNVAELSTTLEACLRATSTKD